MILEGRITESVRSSISRLQIRDPVRCPGLLHFAPLALRPRSLSHGTVKSPRMNSEHMSSQPMTLADQVAPVAADRVPIYSWYALIVLTLVYVLNFLDRTLIYILFTPIKKEMAFTDLQLALLGSTSFVIFYTLLGIPFGRLADRTTRKYLIAGGLAVW